jgi:hypothetical protein
MFQRIFKSFIFLSILIAVCGSCYKSVEIDFPPYESELFIAGIIEPDSTVEVSVSRTFPINHPNNNDYSVDNAEVILYENGVPVDTLLQENSYLSLIYKGDYAVKYGREYGLSVKHNTYHAQGVTTFPEPAAGRIIAVEQVQVPVEDFMENALKIKLQINDPPGENYYAATVYAESIQNVKFILNYIFTSLNDRAVLNEGIRFWNSILFNDRTFDGQQYTLTLYYSDNGMDISKIHIHLFSLTEATYLFYRHKYLENGASNGLFSTDPDPIPDNIEGGLGTFSSQTRSIITYITDN